MNRLIFNLLFRNSPVKACLLSGLILLVACEKVPAPLTTNSVITGFVSTDESDEGITVAANGPYGRSSAVTDKRGHFTISGLGNGTYFLDYGKEGYGTIRRYGIQLFGCDTVSAGYAKLFKKPEALKLPAFKVPFITVRPRSFPERLWICIETDITQNNEATYGRVKPSGGRFHCCNRHYRFHGRLSF